MNKYFIFLFIFILSNNNLFANEDRLPLTITNTDKESDLSFNYDIGLGDNLLQGLQNSINKKIDKALDPTIHKLEKIKKDNMRTLNTENYFGTGQGKKLSESWMKFIGFDDFTNTTKDFKEKNKGEIGNSIFNGKKWQSGTSGLNPFSNFNKKIADITLNVRNDINNFNIIPDNLKQEINQINNDINQYMRIDLNTLTKNLVDKKDSKPFNTYVSDIADGKSPEKSLDNFFKSSYPEYFNSNGKATFTFSDALMKTNNMCDVTKCLFGDKDCDMSTGSNVDKVKKAAEKIRKALMEKAVLVLTKKLLVEFYINEYIQFVQRSMSCGVEATMATTMDNLGISYSGTNFTGLTFGTTNNSGVASTNAQSLKNIGTTVNKCSRVDDTTTKTEDNLDVKVALNEQGSQISIFPIIMADYIPFIGVGGGATYSTDGVTKKLAEKDLVSKCIEEGKTKTWKESFNRCMSSGETMKIKINSELKGLIGKLFISMRKHKKLQCQLTKELSKTESLHFSLLKYSDLIPTLIESEYNKKTGFMKGVQKLLNENILINNLKTDNQIGIDKVYQALINNQKDISFIATIDNNSGNDKFQSFTSNNVSDFQNNFDDFCSKTAMFINSEDLIKQKMYENSNYKNIMMKKISDMNYCSDKYKNMFLNGSNISNEEEISKKREDLLMNVLLEYKYKYEDGLIKKYDEKELLKQYKESFNYLDTLSNDELESICLNIKTKEKINDITQYSSDYKFEKNYDKNYISGAVTSYCHQWIGNQVDIDINKMKNDYDIPVLDIGVANDTLKSIGKEELKLKNEGF